MRLVEYREQGEDMRLVGYREQGEDLRLMGYREQGEDMRLVGYREQGEDMRLVGYREQGEDMRLVGYREHALFGQLGSAVRPVVTFNPNWNKILSGEPITMSCNVEPSAISYHWYHNDTEISTVKNYMISLAGIRDSGEYKCQTSAGSTSEVVTLSVSNENTGAIPVTITPNWNKLLTGDRITMECNGRNDLTYQWLQNGKVVAEERIYTIKSAQVGHSGVYQCQTNHGNSLTFSLEVSDGPLILQAPFFVSRGKDIDIKCHSRPEYTVHRTTFYKNNNLLLEPLNDHNLVVVFGNRDVFGRYRCDGILSRHEYVTHTDEMSLHVRDLFFKPNLTTLQYSMTESDNMTLTCDTSLSPLRQGTGLQFAFYRDGKEIQKFSSSHQYKVYSARLTDSGNYSCKARTPTNSVMKISEGSYIQIEVRNPENTLLTMDTYLIILFILLFLMIIAVIVVVIKYRCKPSLASTSRKSAMEPPEAESATNANTDEDLCYANLKISQKTSSPRATENVVYSEIKAKVKT
ncbi:uncharacterized protein ACMZJ9_019958 [Mantella aurantiaca]